MKLTSILTVAGLLLVVEGQAWAQPTLFARPREVFLEHTFVEWTVYVVPDPLLFSDTPEGRGGSLAIEVGFSLADEFGFEGSNLQFTSVDVNEADWPYANPIALTPDFVLPPGHSDLGDQSYLSFGSRILTDDEPVELAKLVAPMTESLSMQLHWGGQTLLEGTTYEYTGARISQAGRNFDNVVDSQNFFVAVNNSDCTFDGIVDREDIACAKPNDDPIGPGIDDLLRETGFLAGDFDLDKDVDFSDFLILSANFGGIDRGYSNGDADLNGTVEFSDFLALSKNFGSSPPTLAPVPEPSCLPLPVVASLAFMLARRRRMGSHAS